MDKKDRVEVLTAIEGIIVAYHESMMDLGKATGDGVDSALVAGIEARMDDFIKASIPLILQALSYLLREDIKNAR